MRIKCPLRSSGLLLAATVSSAALAQAPSKTVTASPEASSAAETLGDIVVTARRRDESLQDVPVAITAVSGAALEQRGIRAVEDLRSAVPGLNISGSRRDEPAFYLRGQGPGIFNFGQRNFASVATYFAEVPTEIAGPGVFFDLANVQILKGPQGTLFGRNTTGGAILFEPHRPEFENSGYAKLTYGNYDYRELEAVMNISLVEDVFAIRLVGNVAKRDGFTQSVITGQKLDARDYQAYRASVLFRPFDGFENVTIVDGRDKDQDGGATILRQINPAAPTGPALQGFLDRQRQIGIRKTLIPTFLFDRQRTFGVTNRTSWELSDTVTLKNIVSFRKLRTDRGSDYDGTPVPTFLIENVRAPRQWQFGQQQVTEEFQVQSSLPAINASYIAGFYHESSKPGFNQEVRQSLFGTLTVRLLDYRDESTALFGHVEVNPVERLHLSGGFRYTWDKRSASIGTFNTAGACTQRVPPGTGPLTCPFAADARFKAPTYDATVQYDVARKAQVYVAYRHGYKSGGVNLPSPGDAFTRFNPEYVDEYEIGLKADWDIGVPFRTNVAFFLDKYDNIQISSPVVVPNVGFVSLVQNVAKATNKGVELESTIVPVRNLSISGYMSYLDSHSDVTVAGTAAVKGRQTAFQPKWKYGVSARYDIPVSENVGKLAISGDYSWQGKTNTNEINPAFLGSYPSYGVLNARVELADVARSGIDLAAFATNLTNKAYFLGGFPLASPLGFESALYGEPRMYGVSAKVRFGR